jgi:membrane protein implicated in regulation of membrane protease activity
VFSIIVSTVFSGVFSSLVGTGLWIGFALFLVIFVAFLGMIVHAGRGRDSENERIRQLAALKSLQAEEAQDDKF